MEIKFLPGSPLPLGTHWVSADTLNFALYAPRAEKVVLCLFDEGSTSPAHEVALSRTGQVWHGAVSGVKAQQIYAYLVNDSWVLDPFATHLATPFHWATEQWTTYLPYRPLAHIPTAEAFNWENDTPPRIPQDRLVIYEMHVRGFTKDPSSGVEHKGKFLGLIEKIPHLKELGINAVELLPIWEFDEGDYACCSLSSGKTLCNFWGYQPLTFFAPMNRYAVADAPREFKTMVKALHQAGIEVFLDVVFNHTGEGGALGPSYSLKSLAPDVYYMVDAEGHYRDFTGCGNTMNTHHPVTREMIVASLRYWVTEMHVDGFRFDLASTLTRNSLGHVTGYQPLIDAISQDPILANIKLIAEPWDAAGLYQVGQFYKLGNWSEWNDKYRDGVRRFIRGAPNCSGDFATRLCGSEDLYGGDGSPLCSLNFITAHDGFTLNDLVSYNRKHNDSNGENNRDGTNNNESWNCGHEGITKNPAIWELRERQSRNLLLALMVSRGIPMLHMGDEYGHTKNGNNNSWCHDNDLNWFQWEKLQQRQAYFEFYRSLIKLRSDHALLRAPSFLGESDIIFHGKEPRIPGWDATNHLVAYSLIDHEEGRDLYIAFNADAKSVVITLPEGEWEWLVNTAKKEEGSVSGQIELINHSAVVLKRKF